MRAGAVANAEKAKPESTRQRQQGTAAAKVNSTPNFAAITHHIVNHPYPTAHCLKYPRGPSLCTRVVVNGGEAPKEYFVWSWGTAVAAGGVLVCVLPAPAGAADAEGDGVGSTIVYLTSASASEADEVGEVTVG